MRLLFLGSGEFGLPTVEHLARQFQLEAVISQPEREAGRHRRPTPTPIAHWARQAGIAVHALPDANDPAFVQRVAGIGADAAVVVAFGQKLGDPLIRALGRLVVNLHASLLPRYRGAAPINWAIIRGELETGLSVISLAQRMDGGLIYDQVRTPIGPQETAGELHDRLARLGPSLVSAVLGRLEAGSLQGRTQDESAVTFAPKLSRADGWVDFADTARAVRCRVHGLTPWPGVPVHWARRSDGLQRPLLLRRVAELEPFASGVAAGTVLEADRVAVGDGAVRVLEVQEPGGRPMEYAAFARGHRIGPGDRLLGGPPQGGGEG
jgi:methionyl-tRNA formyltransferase